MPSQECSVVDTQPSSIEIILLRTGAFSSLILPTTRLSTIPNTISHAVRRRIRRPGPGASTRQPSGSSRTFATDSTERRYIPFFIAAAAVGATFLVFHFLDKYRIEPPWWASPPVDTMA